MASSSARDAQPATAHLGQSFSHISASGHARQQNGNITNSTAETLSSLKGHRLTSLDYSNTYPLRQRRSDETLREDQRSPLLLKASAEGQTARIRYLFQLGVNLDYRDDDGLTALHHAVLSGFEDTVETLIDFGADVNAASEKYGTPLCLAALKARNNILSILLIARASVHGPGGWLGSPLHCASSVGDISIAEILLERGARPNELRSVHLVSSSLPHGSLLASAASKSLFEPLGPLPEGLMLGPLHIAICKGNLDVAKSLLRFGADTDIRSSESQPSFDPGYEHGFTPLMAAACFGYHDAICLLLEHGANVSLVTISKARSALMLAVGRCQPESLTRMIQHGAAVNDQDLSGMTALFDASISGRKESLDILLKNGADLRIKDGIGFSALHRAVNFGQTGIVETLLDAGADFNDLTYDGYSPLDLAVHYEQSEIAHELARRGARFADHANGYSLIRLLHVESLRYQKFGVFESDVPMPKFITVSLSSRLQQLWFRALQKIPLAERVRAASFPQWMEVDRKTLMDMCSQIKLQKVEWLWSRYLCVNDYEGSELETAMNSAVLWLDRAELCFVYLSDLSPSSKPNSIPTTVELMECTWFTESWSLQDLLAGKSDNTWFFDSEWNKVGTRSTLEAPLSNVMRIRPEHLHDYRSACVAAKLSWGSRLDAARKADRSYAMFGILEISLAHRYGEDESEAFRRLQEAIIKETSDESLFAWSHHSHLTTKYIRSGLLHPYMRSGLLAPSIDYFAECGDLEVIEVAARKRFWIREASTKEDGGINVEIHSHHLALSTSNVDVVLRCRKLYKIGPRYYGVRFEKRVSQPWRRTCCLEWRTLTDYDPLFLRKEPRSVGDIITIFVHHETSCDDDFSLSKPGRSKGLAPPVSMIHSIPNAN